MRYLFIFIILCVCTPYIQAQPLPADSICTLTGDIRGLGNNRLILEYPYGRDAYCSDTIRAHHGHFVFSSRLPEPTTANIRAITDGKPSKNPQIGQSLSYRSKRSHHRYPVWCSILLENRPMSIRTSLDSSLNLATVENAPLNDTVKAIRHIWSRLYMQDTAWLAWKKAHLHYRQAALTAADRSERDSILNRIYRRQEDTTAAFIRSHPSSYAGLSLIWFVHRSDSATRMALYNAIDSSLRGYPPVEGFKNNIHTNKAVHHLSVGEMAPEISLADTSGSIVALSSVRGKVTLVDFWASWCGPCRAENPNVVSVYRKYHKKGLQIYSVSLDNDKSNWKAAIQHDKLKWKHVSGLKGWDDPYVKAYGVGGIPDNFLLDKNGKVIAANLRGNELEAAVSKALK